MNTVSEILHLFFRNLYFETSARSKVLNGIKVLLSLVKVGSSIGDAFGEHNQGSMLIKISQISVAVGFFACAVSTAVHNISFTENVLSVR